MGARWIPLAQVSRLTCVRAELEFVTQQVALVREQSEITDFGSFLPKRLGLVKSSGNRFNDAANYFSFPSFAV